MTIDVHLPGLSLQDRGELVGIQYTREGHRSKVHDWCSKTDQSVDDDEITLSRHDQATTVF